jgi:two-component system chemotaxis response regulator CheB
MVRALHPDVVTIDLDTPELDGLNVLDRIMHDCPTPVVLVSSVSPQAASLTLKGLDMGAVDFLLKEPWQAESEVFCQGITAKIRAASRIRVIRSLRLRQPSSNAAFFPHTLPAYAPNSVPSVVARVIVIGASTGGPMALRDVLGRLPADFPAAIFVVQHIPEAFTAVFAAQLQRYTAMTVRVASDGCGLESGRVLVAPGGLHLLLHADARVRLDPGPAVGGHCPSIDVTMRSVVQVCGRRTLGIILTGMGADGVKGLVAIHAAGGETMAQDAASCVIDGMPQQARDTGIIDYIGTPAQIAQHLLTASWAQGRNPIC